MTFRLRSLVAAVSLISAAVAGCQCDENLASAGPAIALNPSELQVGPVAIGTFDERYVEVRNIGRSPLFVESIEVIDGAREVSVVRALEMGCGGEARTGEVREVAAGGCARFVVRIAPTARHEIRATVRVTSDAINESAVDLPVYALGVEPGIRVCPVPDEGDIDPETCSRLSDDPPFVPEIAFGQVPIGDERARRVRLFNDADGTLAVVGPHVRSDAGDTDFRLSDEQGNVNVAPGGSADVEVFFSPRGDGAMRAFLVLPNNSLEHPQVEVPLVAEAMGPRLCLEPAGGLDFGSVEVGLTRTLTLTLVNCGLLAYDFRSLSLTEAGVDTKFEVTSVELRADDGSTETFSALPPVPLTFTPGSKMLVDVRYAPRRGHDAGDPPDQAFIGVQTTYQTGRVPLVGRGSAPACGATQPQARIKVLRGSTDITSNPRGQPLETLVLDGTGSTAPSGGMQYQWRVVSQPSNGTVGISPATGSRPNFYLELAGEYVVELVVRDRYGCQSPPVTVTIHSVPRGKVHVQLTWPQSFGDVDLHYLGPGGTFGNTHTDLHYYHSGGRGPDWGLNNTTQPDGKRANDATLDIDALWGHGPENVNHDAPFDATFDVRIHYYCSRRCTFGSCSTSYGAATATLKVFVDGVPVHTEAKSLTERDVWEAAKIVVSNGGQQVRIEPGTTAPYKIAAGNACR